MFSSPGMCLGRKFAGKIELKLYIRSESEWVSLMIALSSCDREECNIQLIAVVLSHKKEKMYPSRFFIFCGS